MFEHVHKLIWLSVPPNTIGRERIQLHRCAPLTTTANYTMTRT